jgi:hypothetical protein
MLGLCRRSNWAWGKGLSLFYSHSGPVLAQADSPVTSCLPFYPHNIVLEAGAELVCSGGGRVAFLYLSLRTAFRVWRKRAVTRIESPAH